MTNIELYSTIIKFKEYIETSYESMISMQTLATYNQYNSIWLTLSREEKDKAIEEYNTLKVHE